jgi:hypothetical protein
MSSDSNALATRVTTGNVSAVRGSAGDTRLSSRNVTDTEMPHLNALYMIAA